MPKDLQDLIDCGSDEFEASHPDWDTLEILEGAVQHAVELAP